jgi:hypothetical protein
MPLEEAIGFMFGFLHTLQSLDGGFLSLSISCSIEKDPASGAAETAGSTPDAARRTAAWIAPARSGW